MEQLMNYDQILKGFKVHTAQDVPVPYAGETP